MTLFRNSIGTSGTRSGEERHAKALFLLAGGLSSLAVFLIGINVIHNEHPDTPRAMMVPVPITSPARAEPPTFPADTHMPARNEGSVSGSIDLSTFFPESDLVRIEDERVWWESENDNSNAEDDHIIHRSIERPLRRLIELVSAEGGTLEVHDAYRPIGEHNPRSLHKEGRAVDLTCDQMTMERLAKLAWASGFDWVFHEDGKGGLHVHASVRRDREPIMMRIEPPAPSGTARPTPRP